MGAARRVACIVLLVLVVAGGRAGTAAPLHPGFDPTSPATVYRSFIDQTERIGRLYRNYEAEPTFARQFALGRAVIRLGLEAFDLAGVPVADRPRTGAVAAAMLADILLRLPPLPEAALAEAAAAQARWTIPGTEIRIRRIAEGPRTGDFAFSADTLARLAEFHDHIIAEPPLRAAPVTAWIAAQRNFVGPLLKPLPIAALPAPLRATVFGTPAWKAMATIAVFALVPFALVAWSRLMTRRASPRRGPRRRLALLSRPLALALLLLVAEAFVATQVSPGGHVAEAVTLLVGIALVVAAAWAAWHVCWLVAETVIASPSFPDDTYDAHLLRMVARVGSVLAVAAIVIYGANLLGLPALGLLAGVSIGGIALALAAQSTVENLLGGIAIFADRPFRVGDVIRYGETTGTVEAIGPRSSRIRGADGALTTVPNSALARTQVTNLSARDRFVFAHAFALPAGIAAAEVARLAALLRERLAAEGAAAGAP
ncbi:mechanosensitive ion channel family protein, partial [Falsiroseomonas oryzae]|uniref:mechanosensitive ion channel family protein n=1 Tax=Falsiroseomonas oryzae TaxID=2766473 RepID=UPI0022EB8CE9